MPGLEFVARAVDAISEPEKTVYSGVINFSLAAGKTLSIETAPAGEEILSTEVPVGKEWNVILSVKIEETAV